MTYKIVRHYMNKIGRHRTIATGLTLQEAQAHCSDPDSSSQTAKKASARRCTKRNGPWFDGYDKE